MTWRLSEQCLRDGSRIDEEVREENRYKDI